MRLIDDRGRKSPNNLKKNSVSGIKSKLYILFKVSGRNNGMTITETILGNSKFEIFDNRIDFERGLNNAKFNMYWIAVQRGFNSDVRIINIVGYGFSVSDNVTVKRVKRRGKYYNYTYVKGVRGVQKVEKWSSKSTNIDEEINDIVDDDFTRASNL